MSSQYRGIAFHSPTSQYSCHIPKELAWGGLSQAGEPFITRELWPNLKMQTLGTRLPYMGHRSQVQNPAGLQMITEAASRLIIGIGPRSLRDLHFCPFKMLFCVGWAFGLFIFHLLGPTLYLWRSLRNERFRVITVFFLSTSLILGFNAWEVSCGNEEFRWGLLNSSLPVLLQIAYGVS